MHILNFETVCTDTLCILGSNCRLAEGGGPTMSPMKNYSTLLPKCYSTHNRRAATAAAPWVQNELHR